MQPSGTVKKANSNSSNVSAGPDSPLDNGACQPNLGRHRLIAYSEDPIALLARQVISDQKSFLPNLTHVTVIINNPNRISALRQQLLHCANAIGCRGLLGPSVCSLRDYVTQHSTPTKAIIGDRARELMLYKALAQRQQLFGEVSTWFLVDNLLSLFDELSANHTLLPDDGQAFIDTLIGAYSLEHSPSLQQALSHEANIVHTLWHAYQDQLDAHHYSDTETTYRDNIKQLCQQNIDHTFYVIGYHRFLPSERAFLKHLDASKQICLFVHGQQCPGNNEINEDRLHPDIAICALVHDFSIKQSSSDTTPYSDFINQAYTPWPNDKTQTPHGIKQRAHAFAQQCPSSPAASRLRLCKNNSPEHEAQAIALQLVHWHQQGKQHLAIITEDRRLARRVRALLERFGLAVNDYTGWALSTTSAAAAVDSWLNLIEQDFAYQPLLELLKSPFVLPDWDRDKLSKTTYRFEQDIVRHENVQAKLSRYRYYIRSRQQRLKWKDNLVGELLDAIEYAASPILAIMKTKQTSNLTDLLGAVELSMQRIGLMSTLQTDEAGRSIIEQLQTLQPLPDSETETMPWQEFRHWLARALEQSYFQLNRVEGGIALLPPSQSNLEQFDGLVLAAADASHLPIIASPSPLFNQAVRKELGLRTQTDELQTAFYHFRRLLESAPEVVATYATDNHGEPQTLAPWLQLLNAFHQLAYGHDLHDHQLAQAASDLRLFDDNTLPLPETQQMPAPSVSPELLPDSYSAYTYQQLINCPYRFFAGQCLQLSAPEAIRDALQKSDYGELVHRCLHAFHADLQGLPGPFPSPLTDDLRQAGIELLNHIAEYVFAADLEDNALHRVWLQRWRRCIPGYIDWQIKQADNWQIYDNECFIEIEATDKTFGLKGRIDRVDTNSNGDCIIDYKTGTSASHDEVMSGESVQLPFYTMLWSRPVKRCQYLDLGDTIKQTTIEDEDLRRISHDNQQRLSAIHQQLRQSHALHAWGDEKVCQYCEFHGICRKQSWQTPTATGSE